MLYRRIERMTSEPWNVNIKMKPTLYFDARFWERSPGHTVSVIKNIIYPKVYSNRHHFISHFSSSLNSKKAVAVFSSLKEILSKMKSDQGAVFCIRGTDVAAQVSFPYWEKDWPFDLRSHKMKLNSINLPKITIGYVKKASGLEPAPQIPRTLNCIDTFQ